MWLGQRNLQQINDKIPHQMDIQRNNVGYYYMYIVITTD